MGILVWTEEKQAELRELAPTHTIDEAAKAMGMSFQSVSTACRRYRIAFKKAVDLESSAAKRKAYRNEWHRQTRIRKRAGMPYKFFKWTPERVEEMRQAAANGMTIGQSASIFGISQTACATAAQKRRISFRRAPMTKEEANEKRRLKYRDRNPLTARNERVEAVRAMAPTMTFAQIAEKLGTSRSGVAGLCARYGIKTLKAETFFQTREERAAKRLEYTRAAADRHLANGLRTDGKPHKPRAVAILPAFIKKRTRAELVATPTIVLSAEDKRLFAIEQLARAAEQERKMSTMDICRLFAAGKIDRAEMSRRLAQPQERMAAL